MQSYRDWLTQLFLAGVARCHPSEVLLNQLPANEPIGRTVVFGAGKAAAEMAAVAAACVPGSVDGLVVTRYGHGTSLPTGGIEVLEAGHPIPDNNSFLAATQMLLQAESVSRDDRVIFLFSGGGSALLCAPIDGVSVEQKRDITIQLVRRGAEIAEINLVRKNLSKIKGGRLAEKCSDAELLTYVISDVVGDNLADIASGPSIAVSDSLASPVSVLEKYEIERADSVDTALREISAVQPVPHDIQLLANADLALTAIADAIEERGWIPVTIGTAVTGNAVAIGQQHAETARSYLSQSKRVALISGGELTVDVRNDTGRGGPNLEYLASLMISLKGTSGIYAIACDSDGIDGSEDNAGGYLSPTSYSRAAESGIDLEGVLADNNTYELFSELGDLIVTGPTRTNVNDLRIILVDPQERQS